MLVVVVFVVVVVVMSGRTVRMEGVLRDIPGAGPDSGVAAGYVASPDGLGTEGGGLPVARMEYAGREEVVGRGKPFLQRMLHPGVAAVVASQEPEDDWGTLRRNSLAAHPRSGRSIPQTVWPRGVCNIRRASGLAAAQRKQQYSVLC